VEQDRTPSVLGNHEQLARSTVDQSSGHRRTGRRDHQPNGYTIRAEADTNSYPRGVKISDAQMAAIAAQLKAAKFHGEHIRSQPARVPV